MYLIAQFARDIKKAYVHSELIHGKEYINMVQTYERNEKQLTAKQLYEIQQAEIRHEKR